MAKVPLNFCANISIQKNEGHLFGEHRYMTIGQSQRDHLVAADDIARCHTTGALKPIVLSIYPETVVATEG